MIRLRVFISSVIDDFKDYRQAAKRAVIAADGEPILTEEQPALSTSSRNACLDGVDSADIFVLIIAARGGWKAPSGKLVVQEEYEKASSNNIPILVYVQEVEHDVDARKLIKNVSDYVEGRFRKKFTTKDTLERAVEQSLKPVVNHFNLPQNHKEDVQHLININEVSSQEAILKIVFVPERKDELVDPLKLESDDFLYKINQIAYSPDVNLFSFSLGQSKKIEGDSLIITQANSSYASLVTIQLELIQNGSVVIDSQTTNSLAQKDTSELHSSFVILEQDVLNRLSNNFAFTSNYFDQIDKWKRHNSLLYNVSIYNRGSRYLYKDPPKNSFEVNTTSKTPIIAYDNPRLINRNTLLAPSNEIQRALAMFRRKIGK